MEHGWLPGAEDSGLVNYNPIVSASAHGRDKTQNPLNSLGFNPSSSKPTAVKCKAQWEDP